MLQLTQLEKAIANMKTISIQSKTMIITEYNKPIYCMR